MYSLGIAMRRIRPKIRIPWIFKYKLKLYKPKYRIATINLGLEKEANRLMIYGLLTIILAILFGGIFLIAYEFTPPLIEIGGRAALIYPGLSRETLTEFLFTVIIFIMASVGAYLLRSAVRAEEEEWTVQMSIGLFLVLVTVIFLWIIFSSKVGLLR